MAKTHLIKTFYYKFISFIKGNWFFILILLLGAFLRIYRINDYMTFLGDEGRDVIIVRNLLTKFDPILIGPGTSVGGMYLGPLYYYFMAPFLWLFNYSPVGPAVGVSLLGVATIYLVYAVSKIWFSKRTAIIASLFYAISPVVIVYSRSSWNPNIMPFFALLSVFSIWKVYKNKQSMASQDLGNKYNWLIVCAISFAFVLQSHYLGLLLGPVLFIYWFLSKVPLKHSLISLSVFLFLMSPLAIFDVRHDFLNSKAIYKFFTVREETVSIKPWTAIPKSYDLFKQIDTSLITAGQKDLGSPLSIVLLLLIIINLLKNRKDFLEKFGILFIWLGVALVGFGLYKQNIYDHYFGFLFPCVIILFSGVIDNTLQFANKFLKVLVYFLLGFVLIVNLINNPFKSEPNRQMQRSLNVSNKISQEAKDDKFNIAVIAERNYEDGYQYFLEKNNSKIIEIDAQIPETVTDQLFVICEVNGSSLTEKTCDPTHSSKAEVANFGWSKIENQWVVDGVIIYRLIHTK